MFITIRDIPKAHQRYDTVGDWYVEPVKGDYTTFGGSRAVFSGEGLSITVSNDAGLTEKEQFVVAIHELIEAALCFDRGITQKQVDDFDQNYHVYAKDGIAEPGDHPNAPYRNEHRFAALIEHMVARELGLKGYGKVE